MPLGLVRFQQSGQSHFVTYSCYRRMPQFEPRWIRDLFLESLERRRVIYRFRVYGYVVMPEHVHLLVSEPETDLLATALQALKISVARQAKDPHLPTTGRCGAPCGDEDGNKMTAGRKRPTSAKGGQMWGTECTEWSKQREYPFWQKRYYDHNVRSHQSFDEKLHYIHRNPVKRGLVANPEDWPWSSFRHYAFAEIGRVEIESEWTAARRNGRIIQLLGMKKESD